MVDDAPFEGFSSLVRLSGVNVPARARFVGETLLSATLASLTLGLVCGQVGGTYPSIGPLVPFLIGSWTGYTFGLLNQWRNSKRTVGIYAERFPNLLRHSLAREWDVVVPKDVELKTWIENGGLGRMTVSILAASSCRT